MFLFQKNPQQDPRSREPEKTLTIEKLYRIVTEQSLLGVGPI